MMADKTKLSPTACTAFFQLGHERSPPIWRLIAARLLARRRREFVSAAGRGKLDFSEGVIAKYSSLELKDERGKIIATGVARADPKDKKRLVVSIPAPLNPGRYTVNWHVVSEDTHRVQGQYSFTIER
jgi:hypothetical protein